MEKLLTVLELVLFLFSFFSAAIVFGPKTILTRITLLILVAWIIKLISWARFESERVQFSI